MHKKIIIVGAGIAGLAAYSTLHQHGFDVLILEARSHPGGRIVSDSSLGFPISRGAAWIHGTHDNPITALAARFGADMIVSKAERGEYFVRFDRHEQAISHETLQAFEEKFSNLLNEAKHFAFQQKEDISLNDALLPLVKKASFSSIEEDLFQNKLRFFEGYIGADSSWLSARHWDAEVPWPGENCYLKNGYHSILEGLSNACNIELNTIIKRISIRETDVEIQSEKKNFTADAVIVTLPLGVLKSKHVTFDPPLPAAKQEALNRLNMGLLNVHAFRFPNVFWNKNIQAFSLTGKNSPETLAFFSLHYFCNEPVLLGYCGGERGKQLEQYADENIVARTMSRLRDHFKHPIPDPEAYFFTRWASDPFSFGSYVYLPVGATPEDIAMLSKPVQDRLFFAGEATHEKHFATTHGAYLSGIREAKRIIGKNSNRQERLPPAGEGGRRPDGG